MVTRKCPPSELAELKFSKLPLNLPLTAAPSCPPLGHSANRTFSQEQTSTGSGYLQVVVFFPSQELDTLGSEGLVVLTW